MSRESTPLDHTKSGVAVIVTALVHAMNETDPTFQVRFLKRLEQAAYSRKNSMPWSELDEQELVSWTHELITGFSPITGQGEPLYTGD